MVFTNLSLPSDLPGKTRELQAGPAHNFVLKSFKTNKAAAVPECVNPGIHGLVWENSFSVVCLSSVQYST